MYHHSQIQPRIQAAQILFDQQATVEKTGQGDDEIESVLAREFGHHVHKDVMLGIIVQSVLTLFGFWLANIVMNLGVAFFGYNGLTDPATLPLLIIALSIFGLVTMPLGNLWSRWREVKGDEYALKMTDNPQAFISAMTRLAKSKSGRCRSARLGGVSAAQSSLD